MTARVELPYVKMEAIACDIPLVDGLDYIKPFTALAAGCWGYANCLCHRINYINASALYTLDSLTRLTDR
jgi:hypothetical protein